MAYYSKEAYERKAAYAERRNQENKRKCDTLTEDQHDVLAWICSIRHKLHTGYDRYWDNISKECIEPFDGTIEEAEIIKELKRVGLPDPDFKHDLDFSDLPTMDDYFELLTDEEKDSWEKRAEELNKENTKKLFYHTGSSLWKEESGDYEYFVKRMTDLNDAVESYLLKIDKEHGTNYCPTGFGRLES